MKLIILGIFMCFSVYSYGQVLWQENGDNSTTGNLSVSGAISTGQIQMTSNDGQTGFYIQKPTATGEPFRILLGYQNIDGGIMIGRTDWSSKVLIPWNVGIGTTTPLQKLHVAGHMVLDAGTSPAIYTGAGSSEPNRYLQLISSPNYTSASGLKAGGVLVADAYSYANPGKNDLVVKGNVGIGSPTPTAKLQIINGQQTLNFATGTSTSGYALSIGVNDDGINFSNTSSIRGFNFSNNSGNLLRITSSGNVGIGTGTQMPDAKLAVKGTVHAQEVKVDLNVPGPDYVFEPNYKLLSLEEIKSYIEKNKHLPEVPSAKEMETNGVNVSEMNMLLLKKIEELTLYIIKQENRISELEKMNKK